MIYRASEKTSIVRRHCQCACAVKAGGMWIDNDDLHAGARQRSGMIIVHACQWTGIHRRRSSVFNSIEFDTVKRFLSFVLLSSYSLSSTSYDEKNIILDDPPSV